MNFAKHNGYRNVIFMFGDFYGDKRVFANVHAGFKGSWLAVWLNKLGAKGKQNMLDDNDIQKYLALIKNSKAENQKTHRAVNPNDPISLNNFTIDPTCDIRGIERMKLGKGVVIQKDCWLNIAFHNPVPGPMIVIDEGTNIGRRCTLSAANRIIIGKFVLIAPNVFIADTHHEYQKLGIPIMHQGITTHDDQVTIGDETWIGINTVIIGNVKVGKHCVIGANSVVNKDIPDYCVAVGNPSKIIKTFDVKNGQWVKVKGKADLDKYLAARSEPLSEDTAIS
jgi:acetyltransferase-like isoleucine patch superfamily enzyme